MFDLKNLTKDELEIVKAKHDLCLNWKYNNRGLYFITENNNIVAVIEYDKHPEFKDYFIIYNFEVLEKSNGTGSRIIKALIQQGGKLCLYPENRDAERFWEKLGFISYSEGCGVKMYYYPDPEL